VWGATKNAVLNLELTGDPSPTLELDFARLYVGTTLEEAQQPWRSSASGAGKDRADPERSVCEDLCAYQFAHAQHVEDLRHGGCEVAHVQPDTTLLHVEAETDKDAGA